MNYILHILSKKEFLKKNIYKYIKWLIYIDRIDFIKIK